MNTRSGNGRVLCSSLDQVADAVKVTTVIDEYFDLAAERLGYRREDPVEVWLDPKWSHGPTVFTDCIVFNPSDPWLDFVEFYLTHLLVLWHSKGTALEANLPPVIEQGTAEWLAADLVSGWKGKRLRLYRGLLDAARERGDLPKLLHGICLSKGEGYLPRGEERDELFALGFTLVDRIGVESLRDAAERGPVTLQAVLEMAGVASDGTGLLLDGRRASSGNGRVLGSSADQIHDAAMVALAIDEYFEPTAERLGYRRAGPVEVWLDPECSSHGTTSEDWIVLNLADGRTEVVDWILAHELVHWHTIGTSLQRGLPLVAYEGLAERVTLDLVPRLGSDRRSYYEHLLDAARERGDLRDLISRAGLDNREWVSLPNDDRLCELYALGFTLVDRIGVDALCDAAERGPVTLEAVLEMAGVGPDGTGL